jgi:hypothetical protein
MKEMNTISDFTGYLTKKEVLIRSGHLVGAAGEEELIAYYATHVNPSGEHDFTTPEGAALGANEAIGLDEGIYTGLLTNKQYLAKKEEEQVSYVWDHLLKKFIKHAMDGTNIVPDGIPSDLQSLEEAFRHMALVPRYIRTLNGREILEALSRGRFSDRYVRAFLPGETHYDQETGFFFLTCKVPSFAKGYSEYRQMRLILLKTYGLSILERYPRLKRIVGIASEPFPDREGSMRSSEDFMIIQQHDLSDEEARQLQEDRQTLGILQEGNFNSYEIRGQEYPDLNLPRPGKPQRPRFNRRQRRVFERSNRP